jgi:hypothetical protein
VAELKTKENDQSVTAFLDAAADGRRRQDCQTVLELMREVTGAEPRLWGTSIVGFGKYRYTYESGREGEWPIVGFSPRKNDLTLYLMPGVDAFPDLMPKLGKYKTGKSCLYIKKLEDVDSSVLRALVERSVEKMAPTRVDDAPGRSGGETAR